MKLIALIDSGSSATFIDPSVIVKGNLPVQNLELVEVTQAVTSAANIPTKVTSAPLTSQC
jgi:hypothetical protein